MRLVPDRATFCDVFSERRAGLVCAPFLADGITPLMALVGLGPHPLGRFLLESAEQGGRLGRFSFLGSGGDHLLAFDGRASTVYRSHPRDGRVYEAATLPGTDVLGAVRERLVALTVPEELARRALAPLFPHPEDVPPLLGGAVGFLGYDVARTIERLDSGRPHPIGTWVAAYLFADRMIVFDHFRGMGCAVALARWEPGDDPARAYDAAAWRLEQLWHHLHGARVPGGPGRPEESASPLVDAPRMRGASALAVDGDFIEAVRQARRHIATGDIFQVVLSRELAAPSAEPPLHVFRRLRALNPSPYMFYLEVPDPRPGRRPLYLVGASPEVMVRSRGDAVLLRPIAGTRPRGRTAAEEEKLAAELRGDPKELAEHLMLVDLGRNDLGRVCRFGTVHVPCLLEVERYSHVMHLVSEVRGVMRSGLDAFDLMRATFPAGTVTGAPKVRAMQIIDDLEGSGRGVYAGSVGYFSATGNSDHCITIRTLAMYAGTAWVRVGAGIVADSDPERELMETHNKGMAMLSTLDSAVMPAATPAGAGRGA